MATAPGELCRKVPTSVHCKKMLINWEFLQFAWKTLQNRCQACNFTSSIGEFSREVTKVIYCKNNVDNPGFLIVFEGNFAKSGPILQFGLSLSVNYVGRYPQLFVVRILLINWHLVSFQGKFCNIRPNFPIWSQISMVWVRRYPQLFLFFSI